MADKKKRFRIRLLIIILSGAYLVLITHLIVRNHMDYLRQEEMWYLRINEVWNQPRPPKLIDLSTKEGGETVTIKLVTKNKAERRGPDRIRRVQIFVDEKEVVARLCDFWLGKGFPAHAPYVFRPHVKLNLGSHVITVEDEYYGRFSSTIELTRFDAVSTNKEPEEVRYLFVVINFVMGTIQKRHGMLYD